jgi:hypothetical protein
VQRSDPDRPDEETLELVYEHLVRERDRLRGARREVTARLGPMPAAAGVVLGLFGGLPDHLHNRGLVWAALGVFLVMIVLSSVAIVFSPYRRLARELDAPRGEGLLADDALPRADWLAKRIVHEREVYYGPAKEEQEEGEGGRIARWRRPGSLEAGFDRERSLMLAVQWLLALEVTLLLLSRLLA